MEPNNQEVVFDKKPESDFNGNHFVLIILIIISAFLIYTIISKDKSNEVQEVLTSESDEDLYSGNENVDVTTQNNIEYSNAEEIPDESVDDVVTPLVVKSIYKKNNTWWADVDYVTKLTGYQLLENAINNGTCEVSGMTKAELIAYSRGLTINTILSSLVSGCLNDPVITIEFGQEINQNPKIRSLQFDDNFLAVNFCPDSIVGISEIKESVDRQEYKYLYVGTQGYFVMNATISDGKILKFDQINGCAG